MGLAELSPDQLISEISELAEKLDDAHADLWKDLTNYHAVFWRHWQTLDASSSVAERNRQSEYAALPNAMMVMETRGKLNGLYARYDAVTNILDARIGRSLKPRTFVDDPEKGIER